MVKRNICHRLCSSLQPQPEYHLRIVRFTARLVLERKWQVNQRSGKELLRKQKALTTRNAMDLHKEKARKANHAASGISEVMVKKLTDMRPSLATKYELDDQLVTLAIAQAAVGIAADAASQATGMDGDKRIELEDRLHAVVFDAMNDLLRDDGSTSCL
jgi:regulator of sigma D